MRNKCNFWKKRVLWYTDKVVYNFLKSFEPNSRRSCVFQFWNCHIVFKLFFSSPSTLPAPETERIIKTFFVYRGTRNQIMLKSKQITFSLWALWLHSAFHSLNIIAYMLKSIARKQTRAALWQLNLPPKNALYWK